VTRRQPEENERKRKLEGDVRKGIKVVEEHRRYCNRKG
jgi:hypothetical protein